MQGEKVQIPVFVVTNHNPSCNALALVKRIMTGCHEILHFVPSAGD